MQGGHGACAQRHAPSLRTLPGTQLSPGYQTTSCPEVAENPDLGVSGPAALNMSLVTPVQGDTRMTILLHTDFKQVTPRQPILSSV
jgi:hypothetical protein